MVTAPRAGFLTGLDAELVGRASVALGAGRDRVQDPVDPAVGIMVLREARRRRARGRRACSSCYYRDAPTGRLDAAVALASRAITIGDAPPAQRPLIVGEVH